MLKKRILASSMASVMALSGVSLVAFADTKDYGEAVTKAELEAYVKSFDEFIANEIDNYGTIQADNFRQAIDHANVVLADAKADKDVDYTAAYQMVKTIYDRLEQHTNDELKALLKDNLATYESNNILNEEYQDKIYDQGKFDTFAAAYGEAEFYVDSGDIRGITDAWIALDKAVRALKPLTPISKSDFRTALAAYEQLELQMKTYESWRRGTIGVAPKTGPADDDAAKKIVSDKCIVTQEQLKEMVYGTSTGDFSYLKNGNWEVYSFDTALIGSAKIDSSEVRLFDKIKEVGDSFAAKKGVMKTTDESVKAAYDAALEAVEVYKSWERDNATSGSKSACATLLNKYHNQLVEAYNAAEVDKLFGGDGTPSVIEIGTDKEIKVTATTGVTFGGTGSTAKKVGVKYTAAKHTVTATEDLWIYIDNTKKTIVKEAGGLDITKNFYTAEPATAEGKTVKKIGKGTDILQYLDFTDPTDTTTAAEALVADKQTAVDTALKAIDTATTDWIATTDIGSDKTYSYDHDDDHPKYTAVSYTNVAGEKKTKDIYRIKDNGSSNATEVGKHNALYDTANAAIKALYAAEEALGEAWSNKGLADALKDYRAYVGYTDFKAEATQTAAKAIMDDLANGKTIATCTGSPAEWLLIWRQLRYALDDKFPEPVAGKTYTLEMLKSKIKDAYEIADKTGDAATFATPYAAVVEYRELANEFVKEASALTGYKPNEAAENSFELADGETYNIKGIYDALDGKVSALTDWWKSYQYSYGEVREDIAEVAAAIEAGTVSGDALKTALAQCAYDLSVLKAQDEENNCAFDADRTFQPLNRLKTGEKKGGKQTDEEVALCTSYAALVKAYADAQKGTAEGGYDLSGDGLVDFDDVQVLFDNYVMKGEYDAKYDFNDDKLVDFDDVQIFFDKYVMA